MKDPIRISEAATLYGCSRNRVYELIRSGKLKSEEMLGLAVVSRENILQISEENKRRRELWLKTNREKFREGQLVAAASHKRPPQTLGRKLPRNCLDSIS